MILLHSDLNAYIITYLLLYLRIFIGTKSSYVSTLLVNYMNKIGTLRERTQDAGSMLPFGIAMLMCTDSNLVFRSLIRSAITYVSVLHPYSLIHRIQNTHADKGCCIC